MDSQMREIMQLLIIKCIRVNTLYEDVIKYLTQYLMRISIFEFYLGACRIVQFIW